MAKIKGLENLSEEEINEALSNGAQFVVFRYTISLVLMTFRKSSDIYFIKSGESTFGKSIGYTLINLLLGWWGIPWGPIYTIGSLITNMGGGKDVTKEVLLAMNQEPAKNREVSEDLLDDIIMD